ncbi:hypothetical protein [Sphingomonas sp. BK069]|uniref:hypothetical protein n=1 Tax=Sphingomonas sp. BK069 TaxID=2586979 RepID=UPI00160E786A|nr:hypothetical protein [Sphingomonas sp. BK069]MBB3345965.1 hypothetical protein [Sphingomonas sp. BK069]
MNISGKLVEQRYASPHYYSVLLVASSDEYAHPVPFEIRSDRRLGDLNSIVRVRAQLGGYYRRSYKVTDTQTGEIRTVRPVQMTLTADQDPF